MADPGTTVAAAARRLESAGHLVTIVPVPDALRTGNGRSIDAALTQAVDDLVSQGAKGCDAVVHAWSLGAGAPSGLDDVSGAVDAAALTGLRLVQRLDRDGLAPRLYFVTEGAQAVGGAPVTEPAQAALWGLASAAAVEHPELRCTRIDLDSPSSSDASNDALFAEFAAAPEDDLVALRGGRRFVERLKRGIDSIVAHDNLSKLATLVTSNPGAVRAVLPSRTEQLDAALAAIAACRARPDFAAGTTLITGGLTGLGLVTAEWLLRQGARSFALLARRLPSAEAIAAIVRMREAGAAVSVLQGDVSDAGDTARALAEIRATMRPLCGVVHAAGVLDDAVLAKMDVTQYRNVLAPKIRGAWLLHELTQDDDISFFVLYSSVLSYLGAAGQANHAIANAFLDSLAHYRRGRGLAATTVNWGVWSSVGSAAQSGRGDRLDAMGLGSITPGEGCDALARILGSGTVQGSVMRFSPETWRQRLSGAARSGLLAGFASSMTDDALGGLAAGSGPSFADQVTAAGPGERREIVERFITARAARVLRLNIDQIDAEKPLRAMGLDSLLAVEFRNRMEADTGLSIPTTLIWNYPTVARLAPQVAARLGVSIDEAPAAAGKAGDDLDALLGALEDLSDEDARRALLGGGRVADV